MVNVDDPTSGIGNESSEWGHRRAGLPALRSKPSRVCSGSVVLLVGCNQQFPYASF